MVCAACTPDSGGGRQRAFTDFQLKNLVVLERPHIAVASPALLARALSIAPGSEQFIPPCTTSPTATRVVKIRINKNFDVKNTGRDIVSKKTSGGGVKTVPAPTPNALSTTYDLNLDNTVWDDNDKIIAVKVILKDQDMIFLSDAYSITTVTTTNSMYTCLDKIKHVEDKGDSEPEDDSDTSNRKWDTVTFYVDRSKKQDQKFNIRLIVFQTDGIHVLPLILDPDVQNNG
jgi:hypothetical protein